MTVGFSSSFLNSALGVIGSGASAGTTYTALAGFYTQIHTGDPGASGTSNVAAGDNTRKATTLAAAAGGSRAMNGTAPVWTNVATNETISHLSGHTASAAGTFVASGAAAASRAWADTDTITLSSLTLSFTPVAA